MATGLLADDFGVGGRHGDAFEAIAIEVEDNFQILAADAKTVEIFAGRVVGIKRFGGDSAGHHLLRNEDGERLRALFRPVVEVGENRVLMVEIVIENDDDGRLEEELLREGMAAVGLHVNGGCTFIEIDGGVGGFRAGNGGPFVMDGSAVGAKLKLRGDTGFTAARRAHGSVAVGDPAAFGGSDLEILGANFAAIDHIAELALLSGYA